VGRESAWKKTDEDGGRTPEPKKKPLKVPNKHKKENAGIRGAYASQKLLS